MDFLRLYLDETLAGSSKAVSYTSQIKQAHVEALYNEVQAFFIVPNIVWALWALSQSMTSKISFGYWVSKSLCKTKNAPKGAVFNSNAF